MGCDKDIFGYICIFMLLPLSFCSCSPVNSFRN